MMTGRAYRRHHDSRVKAKVRRRCGENWGERKQEMQDDLVYIGRTASTPHPCSSPYCCGNLRPWYGPTRAEILHIESHLQDV